MPTLVAPNVRCVHTDPIAIFVINALLNIDVQTDMLISLKRALAKCQGGSLCI